MFQRVLDHWLQQQVRYLRFERGWIALHQILAIRPDGSMSTGALRGAQSAYPFTRDYIYR